MGYTLERISNWPLYKIYNATYLTNASKVWFLCIVHTNLSINGMKNTHVHVQNCPCGTVGAQLSYELGPLVYCKVIVEFGRNVFLVDCLLWEPLNMAKISITERVQACSCTRKLHEKEKITAMYLAVDRTPGLDTTNVYEDS